MNNAWPLWALPFWTMGVPLIWAIVELRRTPKYTATSLSTGMRPSPPVMPVGRNLARPVGA